MPLADRCADTVLAVHLLEHLPPAEGAAVLAEMLRLARRRVVVAVPYEDEPNPTWGHVRTFDAARLHDLGAATGRTYRVEEHHGGWLVSTPDPPRPHDRLRERPFRTDLECRSRGLCRSG